MPCKSVVARLLLKDGKARVKSRTPFTIQLMCDSTEYVQTVIAGMDTGSKTIGCAAISNGNVVYQAEITIRDDISKKMQRRAMYRSTRRGRKNRYRKARWLNRASMRREDRIAPSIRSKIDSHLREKKQVESILPISEWKVETASFDIHKITDPDISGEDYQNGNKKGYYNLKAYILNRDGYKCQSGRKVKHDDVLEVHHVIYLSNGGTNTPSNLITLCKGCHADLHSGEYELKGKRSKTKHATHMGIIKSQLKICWDFTETYGYETKFKREQVLELDKTHANDAIAICCEEGQYVKSMGYMYKKRHVSSGDYQQTKGRHSQMCIPTGKLFGLRKYDYIKTVKGFGYVKGKRSSGFFAIGNIDGMNVNNSVNIKRYVERLSARCSTLVELRRILR